MLFDEVYEYISISRNYWGGTYERQIKKKNRHSNFVKGIIKKYIAKISNKMCREPHREIVFLSGFHNVNQLIDIVYQKYDILMFLSRFILKKQISGKNIYMLPVDRWERLLYKGYFEKSDRKAKQVISEVKEVLLDYDIRILLLGNDILFIDRCLAMAAKDLDIPVVTIQHGIFTPLQLEREGMYSNSFWCWSDYIKDEYIKQYNVPFDFVKVIGYPYRLLTLPPATNKRVIFAGVPYHRYDEKRYDDFIGVVKIVAKVCEKLKLEFVYRPHPAEIIQQDRFAGITISKEQDFFKDIANAAMLISDISSTITEAAIAGRNVLQIIWDEDVRKFAELPMYHFTEKATIGEEDIERGIKSIIGRNTSCKPDDYYLHLSGNFAEEFLGSIDEMVKNGCKRISYNGKKLY